MGMPTGAVGSARMARAQSARAGRQVRAEVARDGGRGPTGIVSVIATGVDAVAAAVGEAAGAGPGSSTFTPTVGASGVGRGLAPPTCSWRPVPGATASPLSEVRMKRRSSSSQYSEGSAPPPTHDASVD